jgi:hypothetical protein
VRASGISPPLKPDSPSKHCCRGHESHEYFSRGANVFKFVREKERNAKNDERDPDFVQPVGPEHLFDVERRLESVEERMAGFSFRESWSRRMLCLRQFRKRNSLTSGTVLFGAILLDTSSIRYHGNANQKSLNNKGDEGTTKKFIETNCPSWYFVTFVVRL